MGLGGYRRPKYINFGNVSIPNANQVKTFMRAANRARQGVTKVMAQRRPMRGSGVVTTGQYDKKVMYARKRAPYAVRKRARKSYRRFVKQSLKLVGSNTVVYNTNVTATTNNTTSPQNMIAINLAGTNGTAGAEIGNNDINALWSNDARVGITGKVMMKTAMLDLTCRNSGTFPLECDIYEISYKDNTKQNTFRLLIDQASTDTPVIGAATGLNIVTRGVQLFDFPALSKYGVLITKKTKVFLPAGNTATYHLSNNKPQWLTGANDIVDNTGYVKRGYTRTLAFVFKPVVNTTDQIASLQIGATRKYLYKIFADDDDKDNSL